MDLESIVETRYSTRNYGSRLVLRDVLMRIVAAGNRAHKPKGSSSWTIKELIPMCIDRRWLADIDTIVFVCEIRDYDMPNSFSVRSSMTLSQPRT